MMEIDLPFNPPTDSEVANCAANFMNLADDPGYSTEQSTQDARFFLNVRNAVDSGFIERMDTLGPSGLEIHLES